MTYMFEKLTRCPYFCHCLLSHTSQWHNSDHVYWKKISWGNAPLGSLFLFRRCHPPFHTAPPFHRKKEGKRSKWHLLFLNHPYLLLDHLIPLAASLTPSPPHPTNTIHSHSIVKPLTSRPIVENGQWTTGVRWSRFSVIYLERKRAREASILRNKKCIIIFHIIIIVIIITLFDIVL